MFLCLCAFAAPKGIRRESFSVVRKYYPSMNIQAVIFDRDNTLMHLDAAAAAAIEVRIAAVAPTLPTDAVATHWTTWPGPWPRAIDQEPAFWHVFWGQLAAQYQLPADAIAALYEIGAFYHTCFIAFPDTLACLAALRSRGVRLAILTNFELPSIHLTLQNAGLDPNWFSVLLSSATTGFPKPDARAYLAAAAALDLHPTACAFVDDLVKNVEAAQALGMHGWLLDRTGAAPASAPPHIRDLHELTTLLNISQDEITFT
jgi:FMN phosphatase YigB (HAD superfamily)